MRILNVAMKYDYGDPRRGFGFEHCNFFESLRCMGHEIVYFDFMTLLEKYGRDGMNRRLAEVVRAEQPDVMFTVLFEEQLCRETIRSISESGHTKTVNWFCDDHWRFENFSKFWAPCFNWVISTSSNSGPRYERIGYKNVIHSQFACNHFTYRKLDLPLKYDVTFIGQPHSNRRFVIDALRQRGLNVSVWGHGWEGGRLSQEEMIEVFNQSRINLNLTKTSSPDKIETTSPPSGIPWRTQLKQATFHSSVRMLNQVPFGRQVKGLVKQAIGWDPAARAAAAAAAH
jgi:spore maturation protein CgeB